MNRPLIAFYKARWFFKRTLTDWLFQLRYWRTHVRWFFGFTLRSWWARVRGGELVIAKQDTKRPTDGGDNADLSD